MLELYREELIGDRLLDGQANMVVPRKVDSKLHISDVGCVDDVLRKGREVTLRQRWCDIGALDWAWVVELPLSERYQWVLLATNQDQLKYQDRKG